MSRPEGEANPQPSDSCRMLWPFELSEPDICRPLFVNTDSGGIDIFEKYASSSTYVDALKFRLLHYDEFYSEWRTTGGCFGMSYDANRTTNKDPVPYCGSNDNNSTGVSLSEILFSFMLEKYIVCDACGLRCPSFEISSVLYITPMYPFHVGIDKARNETIWEKFCFRCKKNTWHTASNYLLQPPKYLIIVVNQFRYINNNFTKDRCSIAMDMIIVLGLHQFSLQATIDNHGPSMYSDLYAASINCCKRTFYCNDSKITEFETIDTKNSFTAYVVMYKLIT